MPVRRNTSETNNVSPHIKNHFSINYFNIIKDSSFPAQCKYISEETFHSRN
jgi:hypothetical protein